MEELIPNKRTRNLSKIDISNMSDRDFKATIIRILDGLRKRRNDIKETLTTEIKKKFKKNQLEMKNAIPQIANMLDAMNRRLEGREEQISDLEEKKKENKEAE